MTWKHFPYYWPFVRESMAVKGWIPLTKYPQCRRWSFFDVSWTKLLNEQSNCIWFSKMPWNSCGFTIIHYISMHRGWSLYMPLATDWLMMTSSNGNIFRVTGPWLGESTGHRSPYKGQWCGALMYSLICAWTNGWVNNRDAGDLRGYRVHH